MSRKNAADDFVDTGKNLFTEFGLAALAATGTVKGAQYLLKQIPVNLPQWAREWLMIIGPGVAGIGVSMYADKNSAIWQGVAGGMVLASANGLSDKLIEGVAPGGMSDGATVGEMDLILKPDGYLYDKEGNRVAKANIDQGKMASPALPESGGGFATGESHLLQDSDFSESFEGGEAWAA
ncbi:hypothetical protein [Halalkalibaculum sp. DA384]|uniref:hypothetical protein n=1 Tax=Halalkalibaculum sp. DA384 TaxID=3373606 RepID=UPI0037544C82